MPRPGPQPGETPRVDKRSWDNTTKAIPSGRLCKDVHFGEAREVLPLPEEDVGLSWPRWLLLLVSPAWDPPGSAPHSEDLLIPRGDSSLAGLHPLLGANMVF